MSKFYALEANDVEYVVTALLWQTETNITNNVAYKRAFGKRLEQHTDIGVLLTRNNIVTVGIVERKEDLISNVKGAVALAPCLRSTLKNHPQYSSFESKEADVFHCYISKLKNDHYYGCIFSDERIIFDCDFIEKNNSQIAHRIANEIQANILFESTKYSVSMHYIDCDEKITEAVKYAITELQPHKLEQLEIGKEQFFHESLEELISLCNRSDLLYVKSIARLGQNNRANETYVTYGGITLLVAFALWFVFIRTPDVAKTSAATIAKYAAPVTNAIEDTLSPIDSIPVHNPTEDANDLRRIQTEEQEWFEAVIRKNGHDPLTHLYNAIKSIPYEVVGFKLVDVSYEDQFDPNNASLNSVLTAKYGRIGKNTISDFLQLYPTASITLDGETPFLSRDFAKSTHEKGYWFSESNEVPLETIISRLQRLKNNESIEHWTIRKDTSPKRPRSYTAKEQSLMARMGMKESEKDDSWITRFEVYRVTVTFRFASTLPSLDRVFDDFKSAILSKFEYQAATQLTTIEVLVYDML
ncbi:TPA: hypothetical protein I7142_18275 [Vibrio vulnificus]|nr:hypothetical protein [Vibrio vulnificus]HAS6035788.1 hypothetical protein [Vibrio vulnificus]